MCSFYERQIEYRLCIFAKLWKFLSANCANITQDAASKDFFKVLKNITCKKHMR